MDSCRTDGLAGGIGGEPLVEHRDGSQGVPPLPVPAVLHPRGGRRARRRDGCRRPPDGSVERSRGPGGHGRLGRRRLSRLSRSDRQTGMPGRAARVGDGAAAESRRLCRAGDSACRPAVRASRIGWIRSAGDRVDSGSGVCGGNDPIGPADAFRSREAVREAAGDVPAAVSSVRRVRRPVVAVVREVVHVGGAEIAFE